MVKFVIASLLISTMASMSFAASGASASGSSAKEVEMEMSAEREIIIKRGQPDAPVYFLSGKKMISPALLQAMTLVKQEKELKFGPNVQMSVDELVLEVMNRK